MRILANPVFAIGMVSLGLLAIAQYRLVYIPLEAGFHARRERTPHQAEMCSLRTLGIAMMMPVGGRLADRVGARIPVAVVSP
ncbi:MAG: hypothetical protein R2789_10795 [Microthrixaceae bacterium]